MPPSHLSHYPIPAPDVKSGDPHRITLPRKSSPLSVFFYILHIKACTLTRFRFRCLRALLAPLILLLKSARSAVGFPPLLRVPSVSQASSPPTRTPSPSDTSVIPAKAASQDIRTPVFPTPYAPAHAKACFLTRHHSTAATPPARCYAPSVRHLFSTLVSHNNALFA